MTMRSGTRLRPRSRLGSRRMGGSTLRSEVSAAGPRTPAIRRRPDRTRDRIPARILQIPRVLLLLLASLAVAPAGHAACPPVEMENTWMGVLARWQQQGVPPAQVQAFVRQGVVPRYPVTLFPPSGPAPLAVGLIWPGGRDPGVRQVEVDFDGDGTIDVADARDEALGHVYQTARTYAATIRIHESDNRAVTYAAPVAVLTPAAFETELQGRWAALRTALQRGDLPEALECVHSGFRRRNEHRFRDLLRGPVEAQLPPIRFVEFFVAEARYRSPHPAPGQTRPRDVRFQPDFLDGVWRLTSIFTEVEP